MKLLEENLKVSYLHLERLKTLSSDILQNNMLEKLEDFETIKTIDAFVYRFLKLQDYMGQKLFKNFLTSLGEDCDNLSFVDILDKLEKLNIIPSTDEWIQIRKLRNKLTHEYPDNISLVKDEIILAIEKIRNFEEVLRSISSYVKDRKLLDF
ncbi:MULTISPECIES: hypothetical protein [unclassified Hydrogenobaculum]|jgi:uncharacterized protein with HEPN domain|uniref:hypothetical protein n=1 Tax=unclassified Hydrogenobaculum TaxID=2622382 RepID=UPI0001C51A07|nr:MULTISPECIES: hypothetical protein [unclassified Hydrogenobaculum]AEF19523.1 hypothetical protein Hyd3684_1137 [Hydrogenobaculum sp. 3684]AEG46811.1 hypothetical protein HydSHO_1139 [Hydrogenobaculum sp. SHO]AGG15457.1 hypothetical protein HydHO_1142 [Hydrogenobaculum sp. HO]AGH93758.1 hypothetical protein HydSN_1171 [Hydrogenobaculum sp. SN]